MTLDKLYKIIEDRKKKRPDKSYVVSLFKGDKDRIVQKIGEEAIEVIIAAKNKSKSRIISEVADLFFHTLIMLSAFNIDPKEVLNELEKRDKSDVE
jgi:phosphoribosyl-ATP pyrophosphohydrolase